jgi:endonuclease/exonuclease/phosphatase (EEP) superfamily protein YafD
LEGAADIQVMLLDCSAIATAVNKKRGMKNVVVAIHTDLFKLDPPAVDWQGANTYSKIRQTKESVFLPFVI